MRNSILYIVLWFIGVFICMTIFFQWKSNNFQVNNKLVSNDFTNLLLKQDSTSLVSDIFLSLNELEIIRGKGLIDAKYRYASGASLAEQIKNNPDQLYHNIANQLTRERQTANTNSQPPRNSNNNNTKSDFSIKPLPK